jgi:Flp pilus assembly pilin Flp
MKHITSFVRDENGQGMAEYAFILSLVVAVSILSIFLLGSVINNNLSNLNNKINQV